MEHLLHLDTDVVCLLAKLNSYDYIIVGSGFGGGPLAEQLVSQQYKVLLIERGSVIFSTHVLNTSRPYFSRGASNSPEGNERVYDAVKAKVQCTDRSDSYVGGPVYCVGGRSNLWGTWIPEIGDETLGAFFPTDVVDYLKGDLVQGYKKAFRYLTDSQPGDVIYPEGDGKHEVSATEIGDANQMLENALSGSKFDLMPIAAQFNAPAPYKFAQGAYSTTLSIINRMYANDQYLSVLLNTEVIAVQHTASNTFNKSVNALKIRDKSTNTIKELDVGRAKVILSAGTIGTASIALNSGLDHLNPLVGKGLIDHNVCYVRFAKQKSDTVTSKPLNLKTHLKVGGEECLVTVTINANFFLAGSSATLNTTHFYRRDGTLMSPTKDAADEKENFDTICVLFEFVGKLDDENSVLSLPGLDPVLDIRRPPIKHEVQCAMEDIIRRVRDAFVGVKPNQATYADPGVCPDPGLRPQHLGFGVFSHECGTMRMDGPKGPGVVDSNLKVKGLDNLWVCDLSVLPVSPEANPSLTLAALSLRLAEHLCAFIRTSNLAMSTQQFAKDQPEGFSNRIERVTIVGAGGRQGAQITEQLLKTGKHSITALTRFGSTSKLPDNVKSIPVDYEDEKSIASALRDQQLLIITLAVTVDPEVHHRIVRAAGKAGIRYIIPNIYAANVVIENQGSVDDFFPAAPPINLIKEIERVGVSAWILLVGGVWFDYSLPSGESFMGFDIDNRKATLFDNGEAKINTSTLAQFGRAAAAIASLKELPDDEDDKSSTIVHFCNKPVYLSSFYVSQKDILRSIQRVTNTTDADWEITYESSADRIENGKAMGRSGNIMGLVQAYYSFIFSPEGQKLKTQDKLHNELLGLPEEDLDEVVKDCVEGAPASRGTYQRNLGTSNFFQTMSFGFGVGDFIAVGELCWKIYTRVYKVSRDAPEELRALIQELGNLSNTVNLLNEEVRDQEEWIKRAGERRLEYTCKVMGQVKATVQKMDRLADKYAELGKGDALEGSRRPFRIQWNRVKFAFEVSSINELRAKLDELRNLMIGHRISPEGPLLNAPLDDGDRAELSAAFLRSAEIGNRPWASIAIDDWLQAGKWWLLKVRSQMNHFTEGTKIQVHAYINLLKACWILADIVSIHPQRVHLGASNDRRSEDIRNLSQVAKRSLENFPVFEFQLRDVEDNTINIWPQLPPLGATAPPRQFGINRDNLGLQTSPGEVLFQCFAQIHRTTEGTVDTESTCEECFLILEVPRQGIYLNVVLKNFVAHDLCKMKLEPEDDSVGNDDLWIFLETLEERLGSTVKILNIQGKLRCLEGYPMGIPTVLL
ncbi:uncharacterized protein FTJAE_7546 [Fusarium tjaetaba]|uniref:Glucose-methanol-choline oxidoreductase N-terminal domain-containing protein n=1 Tax=Fusarium tjaetaba TaxID=1567544 RepID=A0A8H5RI91_9HYPO|nr:uncharacterized protein FTJAE_7546 [Fusarium tjaetaba]KAF5632436.1 hypothetical protein FTJAE_7546 [Fusarium tjaetaba]